MKIITRVVDSKVLGGRRVDVKRNYFVHPDKTDTFKRVHKEFSREDVKLAKAEYRLSQVQ